jgi:hypothetical protein
VREINKIFLSIATLLACSKSLNFIGDRQQQNKRFILVSGTATASLRKLAVPSSKSTHVVTKDKTPSG